jgi:hypothetical protein
MTTPRVRRGARIHRRMKLRRRSALLACCALVAIPLAGCGDKTARTTFGDTEGSVLNVGPLLYQVMISRELNPYDNEDKAYLQGVPGGRTNLGKGQSWFAVFVRVDNEHEANLPAATQFQLRDTQNNIYTPVVMPPGNQWAYRGGIVPGHGYLPEYDTPADNNTSIRGLMLLFKLGQVSYDDRPLELIIQGQNGQEASVDLDV